MEREGSSHMHYNNSFVLPKFCEKRLSIFSAKLLFSVCTLVNFAKARSLHVYVCLAFFLFCFSLFLSFSHFSKSAIENTTLIIISLPENAFPLFKYNTKSDVGEYLKTVFDKLGQRMHILVWLSLPLFSFPLLLFFPSHFLFSVNSLSIVHVTTRVPVSPAPPFVLHFSTLNVIHLIPSFPIPFSPETIWNSRNKANVVQQLNNQSSERRITSHHAFPFHRKKCLQKFGVQDFFAPIYFWFFIFFRIIF